MNKKYLISLLLVFVLTIVSACGNDNEPKPVEKDTENAEGEIQMPEPDLEGIPEVVAEVNGSEISGEDFEAAYTNQFMQASMQAQMSGQEVDQDQLKSQILEMMIEQELLIQGADDSGIEATEDAINEALEMVATQSGMETTEDFITAVEEQGTSKEEVMKQLAMQVKVESLIKSETGEVDTSDEALQAVYDEIKAVQEAEGAEEFPEFDEAKDDLVQYVTSQQEGEVIEALIKKYREAAKITINL